MHDRVPVGWTKRKLSSVAVLEYGKSPSSVKDKNGQYPIIGTSGLVGNATDFIWDKTSVVIGRKGTINKPIYINTPFWAIDTTYFCKFLGKTHPKWFYYQICEEALEKHNEASGVPSLSRETLKSIQINTPPLPEQKKIASILTSVDKVIETTQKQIDKLQDLKTATMNELLTKGIGHSEFKDSELGRIPKSWDVMMIGEMCEIHTGTRDTQNKERYAKYPFFVRSQKVERISTYSYDGEAILTAGDGVGTGKIFHYIEGKFDFHQRVYKLSDFSVSIVGKYLFYYFSTNFLKQVNKFSAKGSVDSVRMEMISGMQILVPPKHEQIKIAEILTSIEKLIEKSSEKLSQTQFLKKSLMQDLLTGKVRVQVN